MRTPKRTSRKVMKAPQAHGSRSKISALGLTLALISGSASAYFARFFKRWHSCQLAISLFKIKCIPDPGSAESGSQSHVLGDLFTLSTSTRLISGHSHG